MAGKKKERVESLESSHGESRERVVLGDCGESCSRGLWRELRSCMVDRVLGSRVVNRVAEESRVGEARVRAPSDASHRRVLVQARAPCPTPEGLSRSGRAEGRRAQGSRDSHFLFIGFCVNACGRRLWDRSKTV